MVSSALTSMLLRTGRLDEAQVARIETQVELTGTGVVEAIAALELLEEDELVALVGNKLGLPVATAEILARVEPDVAGQLPGELAWAHEVLPVSVDEVGNLTLAMADPTLEPAVVAAAAHTGAYLVRAIAPLRALREALTRFYGPPPPTARSSGAPREVPPNEPSSGSLRANAPAALAEVVSGLLDAPDRDGILEVLVSFLAERFDQVILFVHLRNQLQGRDARGPDLLREAVTQVRIPTTGPSAFADVVARGLPHFGPWPADRPIDRAFAEAMGGIAGNVLLLPVRLREKVPVLVFAAGASPEFDAGVIHPLADAVSHALERLIFRQKSRTDLPAAR